MKIADLVIGQYVERTYSIKGTVPAKKNSKLLARGRLITKPEYQQRIAGLSFQILNQGPALTRAEIFLVFRISSMVGADLDNQQTTLVDILKDRGVLVDDSLRHVTAISAHWEWVDAGEERVDIRVMGFET